MGEGGEGAGQHIFLGLKFFTGIFLGMLYNWPPKVYRSASLCHEFNHPPFFLKIRSHNNNS